MTEQAAPRISFLRLLLVLIYDAFALIGLLFLMGIIMLVARMGEAVEPGNIGFNLYLLFSVYLYLAWCWGRGGQTLGLKCWRVKVVTQTGHSLDWRTAMKRFLASILSWLPLGLGYLWIIFDKEGLSWHDRLSGTQIIMVPKEKKKTDDSVHSTDKK